MTTKRTNLFFSLNMLFKDEKAYDKAYTSLQKKDKNLTYKDYKIINKDIFYTPLNLRVVPTAEIEKVLQSEYEADGAGRGIKSFYRFLTNKYIGIKQSAVSEFLKRQFLYNATKPREKAINKPVGVATQCGEIVGVDLIDMSLFTDKNRGHRYIFTCIDTFSRKIWLVPMKNKESQNTRKAIEKIMERINEPDGFIHSILSDNGMEFEGEFEEYLKTNNIHHRRIVSHSPQANSVTERANKEVRKILKALFVQNGNTLWWNQLTNVENIKNSSYHSVLKIEPNKVWDARHDQAEVALYKPSYPKEKAQKRALPFVNDITHQTMSNIKKQAVKSLEKYNEVQYKEGDRVRVDMMTIFSDVRRVFKSGQRKQIVCWYAPSIFTISRVVYPRGQNALGKLRYELFHVKDQQYLCIPNKNDKKILAQVYGANLSKVADNDKGEAFDKLDDFDALKLNQCERRNTDLYLRD